MHKNASDFESHGLFDACEDFFEGYMKNLQQDVRNSENGLIDDIEMRSYDIAVGGKTLENYHSFMILKYS